MQGYNNNGEFFIIEFGCKLFFIKIDFKAKGYNFLDYRVKSVLLLLKIFEAPLFFIFF
jgi:hypothetical protein